MNADDLQEILSAKAQSEAGAEAGAEPEFEIAFVVPGDEIELLVIRASSPLPIPRAGDTVSIHGVTVSVEHVSVHYTRHEKTGRPAVLAYVAVR